MFLCRERGGVHSASAPDRVRDGGGGVLAVGQLLVAGAGGRAGGRLTRRGGRLHARVAPAVRGRQGQPAGRGRGLAVARAAAGAARARAPRASARRHAPLPRRLSPPTLRNTTPATGFLTRTLAGLLPPA